MSKQRDKEYKKKLGNTLKEIRKSKGFKQYEVADILGIHHSTYKMWELGEREPSFNNLTKICNLFDLSLDSLSKQILEQDPSENFLNNLGRYKYKKMYLKEFENLSLDNQKMIIDLIKKLQPFELDNNIE